MFEEDRKFTLKSFSLKKDVHIQNIQKPKQANILAQQLLIISQNNNDKYICFSKRNSTVEQVEEYKGLQLAKIPNLFPDLKKF